MKIDKRIPIPRTKRYGSKWYEVIDSMEIGDSVLCDTKNDALSFGAAMKRKGFRASQRLEGFKYRVWKKEKL
jgi:hypothetical protein